MLANYLSTTTTGAVASAALVALGKIGFVFQATKTGTIDRVLWRSGTAVGSPTVDVRLETVGTGSPSGTLFGTNTNVVTGTVASNTDYESTLTAGASVSQGDYLSLVWAHNSGTSIQIALATLVTSMQLNLPQISTAGLYSLIAGRLPYAALRYSDGSYVPIAAGGVAYGIGSTIAQYSTGEKGLRVRFPTPLSICGVWATFDPDVDFTIKLYADATAPGGTAIRSSSVVTNRFIQKNAVVSQYLFSSSVTLAANTWYRFVGVPSGSPGIRYNVNTIPSAAYATAVTTDHHETASSGLSWIDTDTVLPLIGVIVDGLDDGAGSGGGLILPRAMNGGYAA